MRSKYPNTKEIGRHDLKDMASNGCCPYIRGEKKSAPWSGRWIDWPRISDRTLDYSGSDLAYAVESELAHHGHTIAYIDSDRHSWVAGDIAHELDSTPTLWGLSCEQQQRYMLRQAAFDRIRRSM